MNRFLTAVLGVALAGCAHRGGQETREAFISVECVVVAFDPESLVFYALDSIPYDAKSRVSRVRVTHPPELAGRIYSIDSMSPGDKQDEGFEDLQRVGATIRFSIPAALVQNTEPQLIPIYLLSREPNQAPQHNAGSRPFSNDSSASETSSSLGPRG